MRDIELFKEILQIKLPWKVINISVDNPSKRLDVHIGFDDNAEKSVFGSTRVKSIFGVGGKPTCPQCDASLPNNGEFDTLSFQHMPMAGYSTHLKVPAPNAVKPNREGCSCMPSWVKTGVNLTPPLCQYVVNLSKKISDRCAIAAIAGVTEAEVNKVVGELEGSQSASVNKDDAPSKSSAILDLSDLKWQQLISGELTIETKFVALSMLLRRAQSSYVNSPNPEVRKASIHSLHKFFIRNERLLQKEIAQLSSNA